LLEYHQAPQGTSNTDTRNNQQACKQGRSPRPVSAVSDPHRASKACRQGSVKTPAVAV
jgi:hypothetical protein